MLKKLVSCILSVSIVLTSTGVSYAAESTLGDIVEAAEIVEEAALEEDSIEINAGEAEEELTDDDDIRELEADSEAGEDIEIHEAESESDRVVKDDNKYGYHYRPEDDIVQAVDLTAAGYAADKAAPSKYIPDLDTLPKQRNQGNYGTCWAHAIMASAETSMLKRGYSADPAGIDYSELALAYYGYHRPIDPLGGTAGDSLIGNESKLAPTDTILDFGGNRGISVHLIASWLGATSESKVPYSSAASVIVSGLDGKYAYDDVAHMRNAFELDIRNNPELVKEAIVKNGVIDASYFENSKYYNSANNCYYNYTDTTTNHAVAIVGYDDTFPKSNFTTAPAHDGAWLIRNSWTTSKAQQWSHSSYFWISYDDTSISNKVISYEFDPADKYDNNYQYDGCATPASRIYAGDTFYTANVFEANAADKETLKAAMFYTSNSQVDYTIEVYKLNDSYTSPVDGVKETTATTTGKTVAPGYYTIDLADNVKLNRGDKFSIIVTLHKAGDTPSVSYEDSFDWNWCSGNASALMGQSYFSIDGSAWTDLKSTSYTDGNYRIKALTVNGDGATVDVDSVMITGSETKSETIAVGANIKLGAVVSPLDASEKKVDWVSDNPGVATVDSTGMVTGVAYGTANITITSRSNPLATDTVEIIVDNVISSITISGEDAYLKGESATLSYNTFPAGAKTPPETPVWSIEDDNVATVDSAGRVTAKNVGATNVVLTIGRISARYRISVYPDPIPFTIDMKKDGSVEVSWNKADNAYDYLITRCIAEKYDGSKWDAFELDSTRIATITPDGSESYSYTDSSPELLLLTDTKYRIYYSVEVGELYKGCVLRHGEKETVYAGPVYDITYNLPSTVSGNDGNPDFYRYGNTVSFVDPVVDSHYEFNRWLAYTSSGTLIGEKANTSGLEGDITLKPDITGKEYYIDYNGNGNTAGSMTAGAFTYGTGKKLAKNTFVRDDYEFTGWNTKADGTGTAFDDEAIVTALEYDGTGRVSLYAQWTPCTYSSAVTKKATFVADGVRTYTCDIGSHFYDVAIPSLSDVTTKEISYTYTGSEIIPELIVKDSVGTTISESEYTISKIDGQEYVTIGASKVLVTMKENELYEGSREVDFSISKALEPAVKPSNITIPPVPGKTVSMVSLIPNWEWDDTDAVKALPTVKGAIMDVTAIYKGADAGCYVNTSATVTITMGDCTHVPAAAVSENIVPASCTADGSYDEVVRCRLCIQIMSSNHMVIPAPGHNEVTDAAVSANCTKDGKTEGKHCSRCSAVLVAQTEIPALGHDAVTDAAVSANCTKAGKTEGSHCSRCSAVLVAQTEIPALGHVTVIDAAVSANCTEAGKTEGSHCSRCNEELIVQNVIPAKGHVYDEGEVILEPTYSEPGEMLYTCTVCFHENIEKIPAIGGHKETVTLYDKKRGSVTADIVVNITDNNGKLMEELDATDLMFVGIDKIYFASAKDMPVVEGYTFKGFYCGKKKIKSIAASKLVDMKISAVYREDTYNVVYKMTVPEKGRKVVGKAYALKKIPYTWEYPLNQGSVKLFGYNLLGWTTENGGTDVEFELGERVTFDSFKDLDIPFKKNAKIILYPVWEKR